MVDLCLDIKTLNTNLSKVFCDRYSFMFCFVLHHGTSDWALQFSVFKTHFLLAESHWITSKPKPEKISVVIKILETARLLSVMLILVMLLPSSSHVSLCLLKGPLQYFKCLFLKKKNGIIFALYSEQNKYKCL